MTPDVRTVLVSYVLVNLVCTIVAVVLWKQNRNRYGGTLLWAADSALQAIAMVLIVLRGIVPDWASYVLSNTLALFGVFLVRLALERFGNIKTSWKSATNLLTYAVFPLFILVHWYFTFNHENLQVRNINLAAFVSILFIQIVWTLRVTMPRELRRITFGMQLVFAMWLIVSLARIVYQLSLINSAMTNDYFRSGTFDAGVLLSYQFLSMMLTFALVLMYNGRLLADVQKNEVMFARVFQVSPNAMLLTSLVDGKIYRCNEEFLRLAGYTEREVLGRTTVELDLWASAADRDKVVGEVAAKGRIKDLECAFRVKGGGQIITLVSAELVDVGGEKTLITSVHDITERKRDEAERTAVQANAAHSQRLEALGTLASGVAHEINNPLNVVMNYGQLILDDRSSSDSVKELAETVVSESERMAIIVRNLLAFARSSGEAESNLNVNSVIESTLALIKSLFRKEAIELRFVPGEQTGKARFVRAQVQQVVINLLTNAKDAVAARMKQEPGVAGCVSITTCNVDNKGRPHVRITVQDNGVGIDPSISPRIFDPFYSTKTRDKGTGLGLSISYGIVKDHQGNLWFESRRGQGTSFHVDLPVEGAPHMIPKALITRD